MIPFSNSSSQYPFMQGLSAHQIDAQTIIFSAPFRRLLDKAQVFPLEIYDYVRTRLTHSMEVMNVAEGIVAKVAANLIELRRFKIAIRNVIRCSALLHDLGNPPYGHYGEDVIKAFFTEKYDKLELSPELAKAYGLKEGKVCEILDKTLYSDFTNFNGNAQTLRILSGLPKIGEKPNTYNLTAAVLGSIIKYPYYSSQSNKFNIFRSEMKVANFLRREGTLIMGEVNPLALIMEAADDIAYTFSDIDDAVKKKLITEADFTKELKKAVKDKNGQLNNLEIFRATFKDYMKKNKGSAEPFETTIQECMNTYRNITIDCCARKIVQLESITNLTSSILPLTTSVPIMGETIDLLFDFLGNLMAKYVYRARPIVTNELEGENIMNYLLDEFTKAVLTVNIDDDGEATSFSKTNRKEYFHEQKVYSLISSHIRKSFAEKMKKERKNRRIQKNNLIYYRLQMVTDYISGMTDSYAKIVYDELKAIS